MRNKAKWYHYLLSHLYNVWSVFVRRKCLRVLFATSRLSMLYTHFWVCTCTPLEIKNGKYIKHTTWLFKCEECGIVLGRGYFELENIGIEHGYLIRDDCDNLCSFVGKYHSAVVGNPLVLTERTCRDHQVQSVLF